MSRPAPLQFGIRAVLAGTVAMALLFGSVLGVQIGAQISTRLKAKRLRQYFAVIVLLAAVLVAADIINEFTAR